MKKRKTISLMMKYYLELFIIVILIIQVKKEIWTNVFLCVIALFLFIIPKILKNQFNLVIPLTVENILYLFVTSAVILGEVIRFYIIVPHWDTILHTISGFIAAALGLSMIEDLIEPNKIENNSFVLLIFIISIAATIGLIWELCEFSLDYYFQLDMQKDTVLSNISIVNRNNNIIKISGITKTILDTPTNKITIEKGYLDIGLIDTMKDLFVTILGSIFFCTIYCFDKEQMIIKQFILKRKTKRQLLSR